MAKELFYCGKPIRTVSDLMKATVKDGATVANGGYDLMLWEDWYKMPHPSISKTEYTDFEII